MAASFSSHRGSAGAAPAARERACLTDDDVLDLAQGRLTDADAAHAHLDVCVACQELVTGALQHSVSGISFASGVDSGLAWGTMFRPGDLVGRRYRIERFIARGGMGEVYAAFDGDLEARVALKTVVATSSDSERAVRRLKAEVQLARRVSHPHVCRIYDLGVHTLEGGTTLNFLTMEYVDGESLRARVARERVPLDLTLRLARQLLEGLAAAHAAGILHRDFKSDNVVLRPTPGGGVSPVILDFGLARVIDAERALTSGTTGLIGTPGYMAPEQLAGTALTTASDVYSFGVVLYEMLTGQLPFSAEAPFERLHRPPRRRPSNFDAAIPEAVDRLVAGCLERRAERRFGTASAALAAVDAVIARRAAERAPRVRRGLRRPLFVAAAALAALTAGALALGQVRAPAAPPPLPDAPHADIAPSRLEPFAAVHGAPAADESRAFVAPAAGSDRSRAAPSRERDVAHEARRTEPAHEPVPNPSEAPQVVAGTGDVTAAHDVTAVVPAADSAPTASAAPEPTAPSGAAVPTALGTSPAAGSTPSAKVRPRNKFGFIDPYGRD